MSDDRVMIFDTTLRDGEQCPGASMTVQEKLQIGAALDRLGIDIIEAGFPASSPGDFESVQSVARVVENAAVCALTRARKDDIDIAAAALAPAKRKRIHTFISTSPLHMKYKLQMTPDAVLEAISDSVSHARGLTDDVEWSCEDGTRSDFEFLCRCFDTAIKAGAATVNIADTVGYILPEEFFALISRLRNTVAGIEKVRFSVHCHDDLGLATANSLAAVRAGARQVECTINGIGERAGNASLEEIVMALHTRRDELGVHTNMRTEHLTSTSQLVSGITGFAVPPNKAIVGGNAFAHESGIHQHGVLMNRGTYEIISPETVGADGSRLVMGKHSGRHALRARLDALGLKFSENQLQDIFVRFKEVADERKVLDDEDLLSLVERIGEVKLPRAVLQGIVVEVMPDSRARATVKISHLDRVCDGVGEGSGAFEAIAAAIHQVLPHTHSLSNIGMQIATGAKLPSAKVTVRLDDVDKHHVVGQGIAPDPNVAFAKAYLTALSSALKADTASIQ